MGVGRASILRSPGPRPGAVNLAGVPSVPALTGPRRVTPEPLNVAPPLIGRVLATPVQRAVAMAADLLVVALLSGIGGLWLVAGLVLVALQLRSQRGGGGPRAAAGWALAGLLALLVLLAAWEDDEPDPAPARAEALAEAAPVPASAPPGGISDAARIAQLEARIAELEQPQPWRWRDELDRLLEAVGVSFGWGIVYFSLLPAWWSGQTLGKKLLGLQVVELAGQPMTVMRCLRRYGGYAAGMATGGLGFLQLLWDVNRQAIQDRTAHTVVLDLRAPVETA